MDTLTQREMAEAIADLCDMDAREALEGIRAALADPFAGLDVPFSDQEGVRA